MKEYFLGVLFMGIICMMLVVANLRCSAMEEEATSPVHQNSILRDY